MAAKTLRNSNYIEPAKKFEEPEYLSSVGLIIGQLRGNESVNDYSIKVGCCRSFLYDLEAGKVSCSYPILLRICNEAKIDTNEFFKRVDGEYNRKKLKNENNKKNI